MSYLPEPYFDEFLIYRELQSKSLEIYVFPKDIDLLEVLEGFAKSVPLEDSLIPEVDSYLIESEDDLTLGTVSEGARDELTFWLKNTLKINPTRADKISNAACSWNSVYVSTKENITEAIVPKYQGDPLCTDDIRRSIVVSETAKQSSIDPFDPLLDHIDQVNSLSP